MITRRKLLLGLSSGFVHQLITSVDRQLAAAERADGRARSVILVNLRGGLSHLDSFDPKPSAPVGIRGEFSAIQTSVPGVMLCEHLPKLATCFDDFAVVRSISHTSSVHTLAQRYMMSGDTFVAAPAMGAAAASRFGAQVPPAYVAIPKTEPNAGALGPSCDPYNLLGDGGRLLQSSPSPQDLPETEQFQKRVDLLKKLDGHLSRMGLETNALKVRQNAYRVSVELIGSQKLRDAASLARCDPAERRLYGKDHWSEYLLLARRLVETGSRFITVTLDDRGGFGSWDTHRNNFRDLKRDLLPRLDHAVSTLLVDLKQRGMLAATHVVVLGEMGRTPNINGDAGRDHHPRAMSILFAGGDVKGGRIIGETDEKGAAPSTEPFGPEHVAYTVLSQLGFDPHEVKLPPHDRRIMPRGQKIAELFA